MKRNNKSLLAVSLIFVAGMVVGGMATATLVRHNLGVILSRTQEQARTEFLEMITARLDLNQRQREVVSEAFGQLFERTTVIQKEMRGKLDACFHGFVSDIEPELSDVQKRTLSKMAEDLKNRPNLPPPPPSF